MAKRLLDAGFPRERLRLLLNRKTKGASFTLEDLEKGLGYRFYGSIADSSREMSEAFAGLDRIREETGFRSEFY